MDSIDAALCDAGAPMPSWYSLGEMVPLFVCGADFDHGYTLKEFPASGGDYAVFDGSLRMSLLVLGSVEAATLAVFDDELNNEGHA